MLLKEDTAILEAARSSFTVFKMLVMDDYQHASHLDYIDTQLTECFLYMNTKGSIGRSRLGISLPPRAGKTQTASILFSAYVLGRMPKTKILLASYSKDLSIENSRRIKEIIESEIYQKIFPDVKISSNSRSKEKFNIAIYDGGVNAVSRGGSVTGKGANMFICDDLIKDADEARSPARRDSTWTWFTTAAMSRLDPKNGIMIVIGTRWHEDDVAGRLIAQEGEQYNWIKIPAIAEENDPIGRTVGDILWPERFSEKFYREQERVNGPYEFSAIYQQNPVARAGNWFKPEWFPVVYSVPDDALRVRAWDKAISTARDACWTAGVLLAKDSQGVWYVEDVIRDRLGVLEREQLIKRTAESDTAKYGDKLRRIIVEQEPGSGGIESAESTIRNLAGFPIFGRKPTQNKDARLEPVAAQAEGKNIRMKYGEWNQLFIDEALSIGAPSVKYRDQMDALAAAFKELTDMGKSTVLRVGIAGLWNRH